MKNLYLILSILSLVVISTIAYAAYGSNGSNFSFDSLLRKEKPQKQNATKNKDYNKLQEDFRKKQLHKARLNDHSNKMKRSSKPLYIADPNKKILTNKEKKMISIEKKINHLNNLPPSEEIKAEVKKLQQLFLEIKNKD